MRWDTPDNLSFATDCASRGLTDAEIVEAMHRRGVRLVEGTLRAWWRRFGGRPTWTPTPATPAAGDLDPLVALRAAVDAAESIEELSAARRSLFEAEHPSLLRWRDHPSIAGDDVEAIANVEEPCAAFDVLALVDTPAAVASLAVFVTEANADGAHPGRATSRAHHVRAVTLLEGALAALKGRRPVETKTEPKTRTRPAHQR